MPSGRRVLMAVAIFVVGIMMGKPIATIITEVTAAVAVQEQALKAYD